MSDTIGSLVDKLATVNLKMFNCQEFLYDIRKMTFEEFKEIYTREDNLLELYDIFKKACDLNFQRNQLIDEIDKSLIELVKAAVDGIDLSNYVQLKHKTY